MIYEFLELWKVVVRERVQILNLHPHPPCIADARPAMAVLRCTLFSGPAQVKLNPSLCSVRLTALWINTPLGSSRSPIRSRKNQGPISVQTQILMEDLSRFYLESLCL